MRLGGGFLYSYTQCMSYRIPMFFIVSFLKATIHFKIQGIGVMHKCLLSVAIRPQCVVLINSKGTIKFIAAIYIDL